ncbi:MAG: hypothetical protein WBA35_13930 [Litorimonas sp.]
MTDGGSGPWILSVEHDGQAGALAFIRSRGDYRMRSFRPVTPGVSVRRIAGIDAIVLPDARPSPVVLEFDPHKSGIDSDYTPFIAFSDGGVAVFLTAFALLPFKDAEALAATGGSLSGREDALRGQTVTLRTDRPLMGDGRSWDGTFTSEAFGFDYAYVGDTERARGDSFTGVVDPGLPKDLTANLNADLPRLFDALEAMFGAPLDEPASILFAAQGFEDSGISLTGGALPGNLLVLQAEGEALTRGTPGVRAYLRHFLAHESAHLFQMQSEGPGVPHTLDWIEEGMADAAASRILETMNDADRAFVMRKYASNLETCSAALSGATLPEALRANSRISYDCGDMLFRITVAALDDGRIGAFWTALGRRAAAHGELNLDTYFAAMAEMGAEADIRARMRKLVSERVAEPKQEILSLMEAVGAEVEIMDDTLQSVTFPE